MAVYLNDVSHRFGPRWALVHLHLHLSQGDGLLLTGDNGSGKTTLLRILATALRPTSGKLELFGLDAGANLSAVRSRLALLTHQNHLYDGLSARENLLLMARLRGLSVGDEQLCGMLERLGLLTAAARPVGDFSAGMKRRLCFGQLLLARYDLVLLDEPFTALDAKGLVLIEQILSDLRACGSTLVISTHDLRRAEAVCDARLHLAHGRAAATASPLGVAP